METFLPIFKSSEISGSVNLRKPDENIVKVYIYIFSFAKSLKIDIFACEDMEITLLGTRGPVVEAYSPVKHLYL